MSHKSLGKDYSLCKAFSSTAQGRRGLSTWSQAWGACLLLPEIHLGWFFFLSVTSILNSWLPHTTTMRKLLTSQTVWHWCGTWSTRRLPRSTSSTVRYPKQSPSASVSHPSPRPYCWLLPWQAFNTASQPSLLPCSHTPYPTWLYPHYASSLCWHPPSPHLFANTCSRGAGEDLWCRSWIGTECCSRIKCVGQGWLSCAPKQGPCVQTS